MRSGALRPAIVLTLAAAFGAAWCLVADPFVGGDPLLGFELAAAVILGSWAVALIANLTRAQRLSRELQSRSSRRVISGIEVNVVPGAGKTALALGVLRPQIYVGDELLAVLSDDEQRAVVLHEDHHRSIWAPVRAAAIEAWLPMVGQIDSVKHALTERLGDLELMADRHALGRGCTRASLASALLKAQPSAAGLSAVSYSVGRRVDALLNRGDGSKVQPRLPYEWLPVAVLVLIGFSCHMWAG